MCILQNIDRLFYISEDIVKYKGIGYYLLTLTTQTGHRKIFTIIGIFTKYWNFNNQVLAFSSNIFCNCYAFYFLPVLTVKIVRNVGVKCDDLYFLILNNERECLLDIAMHVKRITLDLKNDLGNGLMLRLIFLSDKNSMNFL